MIRIINGMGKWKSLFINRAWRLGPWLNFNHQLTYCFIGGFRFICSEYCFIWNAHGFTEGPISAFASSFRWTNDLIPAITAVSSHLNILVPGDWKVSIEGVIEWPALPFYETNWKQITKVNYIAKFYQWHCRAAISLKWIKTRDPWLWTCFALNGVLLNSTS